MAPVAPIAPVALTSDISVTIPMTPQPPVAAPAVPVAAIPISAPTAASPVPVATAPTYTIDQLAQAGATLAQAGKMAEALTLLDQYGIQSIAELKPEQYGAFATELRAIGAQI